MDTNFSIMCRAPYVFKIVFLTSYFLKSFISILLFSLSISTVQLCYEKRSFSNSLQKKKTLFMEQSLKNKMVQWYLLANTVILSFLSCLSIQRHYECNGVDKKRQSFEVFFFNAWFITMHNETVPCKKKKKKSIIANLLS